MRDSSGWLAGGKDMPYTSAYILRACLPLGKGPALCSLLVSTLLSARPCVMELGPKICWVGLGVPPLLPLNSRSGWKEASGVIPYCLPVPSTPPRVGGGNRVLQSGCAVGLQRPARAAAAGGLSLGHGLRSLRLPGLWLGLWVRLRIPRRGKHLSQPDS